MGQDDPLLNKKEAFYEILGKPLFFIQNFWTILYTACLRFFVLPDKPGLVVAQAPVCLGHSRYLFPLSSFF
jgi:hypothetical protein